VLVTVQPLVLDFGSVDVGQTSLTPSSVTVTNLGPATSLTPTIVQPSLFSLAGNTCNTLAAAGTCIISVSFTPTHTGPAAGTLVVAGSVMVSLTGSGSPPADFTQDRSHRPRHDSGGRDGVREGDGDRDERADRFALLGIICRQHQGGPEHDDVPDGSAGSTCEERELHLRVHVQLCDCGREDG